MKLQYMLSIGCIIISMSAFSMEQKILSQQVAQDQGKTKEIIEVRIKILLENGVNPKKGSNEYDPNETPLTNVQIGKSRFATNNFGCKDGLIDFDTFDVALSGLNAIDDHSEPTQKPQMATRKNKRS